MLAFSELVANHSRWVQSSLACGHTSSDSAATSSSTSGVCSNTVAHANVDQMGRLKVPINVCNLVYRPLVWA